MPEENTQELRAEENIHLARVEEGRRLVSAPRFTGMWGREGHVDSGHVETGDFDQAVKKYRVLSINVEKGKRGRLLVFVKHLYALAICHL